ncbi:rhamnogalacturonan lyase [Cellulomonas marina]|uniref:Uncharacterized protein n=1 Tax=Cellulomonas marina TaxID=988821 RepID=A0A1I0Y2B0_9CELL|nr:rhamnogalacturonan lyase [Cellulomonas marina]GIG29755.1 hypothetical protein Cma02nite_23550 [Cellulomonas marina]SFB07461.1 hypothetical protein SAMN05421867_106138 [Cellulomonas marina]
MSLLPRACPPRALLAGGAGAALLVGLGTGAAVGAPVAPAAVTPPAPAGTGTQVEWLDRGLVAVPTDDGTYLSWRLLGTEVTGATPERMTGADFHVYRDGTLVATVTDSTTWRDTSGAAGATYRVVPVVDGRETGPTGTVQPWSQGYLDVPLQKPADGRTPAGTIHPEGEAYTYAANDVAPADVDGDGEIELVVKWDPSNAKDVSQKGYTGNVYVDTYELDGTLLNRIDLGVNIRAGAHYTQFLVEDFDGDGRAEIMLKTAPGTTTTRYTDGRAGEARDITLLPEDVAAGVTGDDDYRLSAAGYRDHLADVLEGWSAREEVTSGQWPATVEEALGTAPRYAYPLSRTDAEALADYVIDVYAPSRSARNDLRTFEGFVLDGPEYLSVLDAATGDELQTVRYEPGRTDDGLLWGDYAMARIEPGNRVDRFLAGVAYLDGQHPSAVFARGYYTRSTMVAYDWDGEALSTRFTVDSGWTPMTNPFDDGPHGRDGTDPEFGSITTQGFHSLSAADVDGDGRHEIVYGSATIDDDGSLLYSSTDTMPEGSATPGEEARLGHGDAMHVTDIDPDRPGLEVFTVHEGGAYAPFGWALRDAATGATLAGAYSGRDTGRGMIGDVDPTTRGLEIWAGMPDGSNGSGLLSATGQPLGTPALGTNQSIRWAGDGTTQIVEGAGDVTPSITDRTRGTLLVAGGTRTNNGTKGNPSLVADVLGDAREELVVRTVDSSALRVFTSTEDTDRKVVTLLHDPQYRAETARQQTAYNQPAYPGWYLASDTDFTQVPLPAVAGPSVAGIAADLAALRADGQVRGPLASLARGHVDAAQRFLDRGRDAQAVRELERLLSRLDAPPARSTLTDRAGTVLRTQAEAVIRSLT